MPEERSQADRSERRQSVSQSDPTPRVQLGVTLIVDPYDLAKWAPDRQKRYMRGVAQVMAVIAEDEPELQLTGR